VLNVGGTLGWIACLVVVVAPPTDGKSSVLWALKPIVRPDVPAGLTGSPNPIDVFIAEGYVAKGVKPVVRADRRTLLRRLSLDLTGLPPTLAEQEAFLQVWTSEFGRTPWSQNTTGRDHNPRGYTAWLAGGGVRGGIVHGATDDVGYKAVEHPHYYNDLLATIVHQFGLNHAKMAIPVVGRTMRLIEEGHGPIKEILG
jgi:hypothetical protein